MTSEPRFLTLTDVAEELAISQLQTYMLVRSGGLVAIQVGSRGQWRVEQVIIGDKGFAGHDFETFITTELRAHLIRPDRKDEKPRFGTLGSIRQWVESVFDTMKGQLTLEDHGGRTPAGIYSRVAARLLALAAGIWHNWSIKAPNKRSLIAYDH